MVTILGKVMLVRSFSDKSCDRLSLELFGPYALKVIVNLLTIIVVSKHCPHLLTSHLYVAVNVSHFLDDLAFVFLNCGPFSGLNLRRMFLGLFAVTLFSFFAILRVRF